MNRDYLQGASCEMQLLKEVAFSKKYDYGFNLHEQRTLFSTDGKNPATLSFLAPSQDFDRTVTETRKKSMAVISAIYNVLKTQIPNQIARYSDEFYPTSTGDNLMKAGIPVVNVSYFFPSHTWNVSPSPAAINRPSSSRYS